jgi:hypothetical protein
MKAPLLTGNATASQIPGLLIQFCSLYAPAEEKSAFFSVNLRNLAALKSTKIKINYEYS